jgi:hypothetical protein
MGSMADLPRDSIVQGVAGPRCPWCSFDCGGAVVSLQAIWDAHEEGELRFAHREATGDAGEGTLTADCPECARPFMVALQFLGPEPAPAMRLLAVRTHADVLYCAPVLGTRLNG